MDQQQQQQWQQQQLQQQFQAQHHQQQQQQAYNIYQSNQAYCFRYQHPQQHHGFYQPNYTNVYQQPQQPYPLPVQQPSIPVLSALDPTAAAAAAVMYRLAQFAGSTVGAAERSMYQPVGHRGNFGHNHVRYGGAGPSFIGRAHGQRRGGPTHVPSTSSRAEPSIVMERVSENERARLSYDPPHKTDQAPATFPPKRSECAPILKTEVPNNENPEVSGCEICKVRCTSLEVLEQHKNGKRHKKNMKKLEEMKNVSKSGTELYGEHNHTSNSNLEASHQTQYAQDTKQKTPTRNLPTEAVSHDKLEVTEQQNKIPGQRRSPKRKMKNINTSETELDIPLICDLCNVKCYTKKFYDRHLSGKKHDTNRKRSKGLVGLQSLYPPNPIVETPFHPQEGKYMPPHVYQEIPVETSSSPPLEENPTNQGSTDALPGCGSRNIVTIAMETTEKVVTARPEIKIKQVDTVEANFLTDLSETKDEVLNLLSLETSLETDRVIPALP